MIGWRHGLRCLEGPLLDHDTQSDRKLANNAHTHTFTLCFIFKVKKKLLSSVGITTVMFMLMVYVVYHIMVYLYAFPCIYSMCVYFMCVHADELV